MSDNDESSLPVPDVPPMKKGRYICQLNGQYRRRRPDDNEAPRCSNDMVDDIFRLERSATSYRWQSEQIAKAVFDNAVNSVIENTSDPQQEMESLMDVYFNNNSSHPGHLEDEAVRMAIRSHGLQKPCSCPEPHMKPLPNNIPFHQRSFFAQDGASTSSASQVHFSTGGELEHDILSEAVAVAIQKKGLGASSNRSSLRFHF